MKWTVCFLALLAVAFGEEECENKKVDGFMECMDGKLKKGFEKITPKWVKEKQDAIDKCFASNDCDKPDYDRDVFEDLPPNLQTVARKMKSEWQSAPTSVKDCIFKDFKDMLKDNINKCLNDQNVPEVKEVPEGVVKFIKKIMAGGESPAEQKIFETIFVAKANVVKSLRQCYESKGNETLKKVWGCFQDVRKKYLFDQMCTDKKSCEKDKLDETCSKRFKEIDDACCNCDKEHIQDLEKQIEGLRADPDADIDAVMKIVCPNHDVDEIMTKVKACYEQNKEPTPTTIKLIEVMRKVKSSGKGPKLQFNKATIDTIHDVALSMMDDEKCYVCKDNLNKDD